MNFGRARNKGRQAGRQAGSSRKELSDTGRNVVVAIIAPSHKEETRF